MHFNISLSRGDGRRPVSPTKRTKLTTILVVCISIYATFAFFLVARFACGRPHELLAPAPPTYVIEETTPTKTTSATERGQDAVSSGTCDWTWMLKKAPEQPINQGESSISARFDSSSTVEASTAGGSECLANIVAPQRDDSIADHTQSPAALDWSDRIFVREGQDIDPIVIESQKLLFFTVPKNSCTEWKILFRRMMNCTDRNLDPHDPKTNGLRYLGHYSRQKQEEFMTDPSWTRAIFLRDPLERLLSAYLDKAIGTKYVRTLCCQHARIKMLTDSPLGAAQCKALLQAGGADLDMGNAVNPDDLLAVNPDDFPLETFIKGFARQCPDVHWNPQSERLKAANWNTVNFIGKFDTLQHDARCLLERIGAWEEFGRTGWGSDGTDSFFARNRAGHARHATDKINKYFTSPELKTMAYEFLANDYRMPLFNFSMQPTITPTQQ